MGVVILLPSDPGVHFVSLGLNMGTEVGTERLGVDCGL